MLVAQHAGQALADQEELSKMRFTVLLVIAFILSTATIGFAEVGPSTVDPFGAPKGTLEVTVSADGVPVADVLTSLASQSK